MKCISSIVIGLTIISAAYASDIVEGVFGIEPVEENTAIAIWVPLESSQSVTGISWFNNDEMTVFPEFLAVAGDEGRPELLSDAVVVGQNVTGASWNWASFSFTTPLASSSDGLYIIMRLPVGASLVAEGAGGGAGIGYTVGDGNMGCWMTADGMDWYGTNAEYRMAVKPVVGDTKGSQALVLNRPSSNPEEVARDKAPVQRENNIEVMPNPFNPVTEIRYTTTVPGRVKVVVYDLRGRKIAVLVDEVAEPGKHAVSWRGQDVAGRKAPSGAYIVTCESEGARETARMILLK